MIWLIQTLLDTNIQLNPNTGHAQGLPVHYGFPTTKQTAVSLGCGEDVTGGGVGEWLRLSSVLPGRHSSVAKIPSSIACQCFNYMRSHVCRWIFNYIAVIKWRIWSFNCAGYHLKHFSWQTWRSTFSFLWCECCSSSSLNLECVEVLVNYISSADLTELFYALMSKIWLSYVFGGGSVSDINPVYLSVNGYN